MVTDKLLIRCQRKLNEPGDKRETTTKEHLMTEVNIIAILIYVYNAYVSKMLSIGLIRLCILTKYTINIRVI